MEKKITKTADMDETDYLLASPANAKALREALMEATSGAPGVMTPDGRGGWVNHG